MMPSPSVPAAPLISPRCFPLTPTWSPPLCCPPVPKATTTPPMIQSSS
uniref:Uncharacterized protein n=1 Tax=Arundo donax TaxID=35708 RepID=A0A0A8YHF4_ARUDO